MTLTDPRWKTITQSEYPWEREALEFVKERLPDRDPFRAWSNFEFIADDGSINEVDLLVLTPAGFFLVEIKSRSGDLTGDAGTWTWTTDGRRLTIDNPLLGANRKARKLASLLKRQKSARKTGIPFLEALVFLSAPDLKCNLADTARFHVCLRDRNADGERPARPGIIAALTERRCAGLKAPAGRVVDRPMAKSLTRAMEQAGIRESRENRRVGDYLLQEIISEGPAFQDWRAVHAVLPDVARRVRIYPVRQTSDAEERRTIARAASREFHLLENLEHPGILRTHDFKEHDLGPAIVFDDFPKAVRLDHFLTERGDRLDVDHRLHFLRRIAEAVQHAHEKRIIHRALCPQSILVTDPERPFPDIKVFNWQAGSRGVGTDSSAAGVTATAHVDRLVEDAATAYMAPEAVHGDDGGEHLDLFSLGAIAYRLFADRPPAAHAVELAEKLREGGGLRISDVLNGAGEQLQFLIQYSTHPDVTGRSDSVKEFLEMLDAVEDELTTPDAHKRSIEDPAQAQAGDTLGEGLCVRKRLGVGASSVGLLVTDDQQDFILKVALDDDRNERLREEAEVLAKLRHSRIVELIRPLNIGGRAGILMKALTRSLEGDRREVETLRHWLKREGRLQLDLLQRFGEDLLSAVIHLEEQGIAHRDIKPDNLAVANVGAKDALHLVLFDFSLSRMPVENIRVGTRGYMDPFLTLRRPPRWDSDAERWAAAVTLYEMAAGDLPVWHDGKTDPALVDCEATIDAEQFEPGIREDLAWFFKKALRREPTKRFDNAEQMLRAWREVFDALDRPSVSTSDHDDPPPAENRIDTARSESMIPELGLSTRAVNALDRVNVLTVNDLLRFPVRRLYRMRGVGQKTRREITDAVRRLRERLGAPPPATTEETYAPPETDAVPAETAPPSVDLLTDQLVKIRDTRANASRQGVIKTLLGLNPELADPWPTQAATGRHLGVTRARVGQVLQTFLERWRRNTAVTGLREDLTRIINADGGIMTLTEAAEAVLTARGSVHEAPLRTRLARAVVRAATEVERTLADPRFLVRREGDRIMIGANAELADYALRLGDAADEIAEADPLLSPVRAVERLQEVRPPANGETPPPGRLIRLAAAAATRAALSGRQELYPRGMDAARALKLSQGALVGLKQLTAQEIRTRVSGRYPEAAPLPDPPELDRLLEAAGLDLKWAEDADAGRGAYRFPTHAPDLSSVSRPYRYLTASGGEAGPAAVTPEVAEARQFEERLRHGRDDGGFVALTVPPRWYVDAADILKKRFDLRLFHMEKVFLEALTATAEEKRVQWRKIAEADAAPPESRDWQRLLLLVNMAMPRVEAALAEAGEFLLICYAGVLARYDRMDVLTALCERAGRPPARGGIPGVWLLIPGDGQSRLPVMEGRAVPVIGSGQHARIPESWLQNRHRADGDARSRQKASL